MVHLSSPMAVGIMVFYSILTFFLGPTVTRPFMGDIRSMYCRIPFRFHCKYFLDEVW